MVRYGLTPDEAAADTIYDAIGTWGPHPDVPAGLAALAERYPLVILSNAADDQIPGNVAQLGAPFHAVITAQQAQAYKPRLAAFEHLLERLGVGVDDIVHVSASLRYDLMPAHDLGIRNTVYVNRGYEPSTPWYGSARVTISSRSNRRRRPRPLPGPGGTERLALRTARSEVSKNLLTSNGTVDESGMSIPRSANASRYLGTGGEDRLVEGNLFACAGADSGDYAVRGPGDPRPSAVDVPRRDREKLVHQVGHETRQLYPSLLRVEDRALRRDRGRVHPSGQQRHFVGGHPAPARTPARRRHGRRSRASPLRAT